MTIYFQARKYGCEFTKNSCHILPKKLQEKDHVRYIKILHIPLIYQYITNLQ